MIPQVERTIQSLDNFKISIETFQAWYETGVPDSYGEASWGSMTPLSSTFSYKGVNASDTLDHENKLESTYLYIQMEYCPR